MVCLARCQGNPDCAWYTFDGLLNQCILTSSCEDLETESCQNCISGQFQCSIPGNNKQFSIIGISLCLQSFHEYASYISIQIATSFCLVEATHTQHKEQVTGFSTGTRWANQTNGCSCQILPQIWALDTALGER